MDESGALLYDDALFHGGDREALIRIMTRYTAITDPVVYQHMSFSAIDPDGRIDLESLSSMQGWYATHAYVPLPADLAMAVDPIPGVA